MTESQTLPTPSLLLDKIIRFKWKQPDEQLPSEVLAHMEEILPPLIELVKDRRYWISADENEWWAPVTAIHLLSLTRDEQALDALFYVLYNYSEEMDDWLDDMPSLLS